MFSLNLNTLGFNKLVVKHEHDDFVVKNRITIFGKGLFDKLVLGILNVLGKVFSQLKPVTFKLESNKNSSVLGMPSKMFTTRRSLEEFLKKEGEEHCHQVHCPTAMLRMMDHVHSIASSTGVLPLRHAIHVLKKRMDLDNHRQLACMAESLEKVIPSGDIFTIPISLNKKTGQIIFDDASKQGFEWVSGQFTVNEKMDAEISLSEDVDEDAQYFAKKIVELVGKQIEKTNSTKEAIGAVKQALIGDEYINFVKPISFDADEDKLGIDVVIKFPKIVKNEGPKTAEAEPAKNSPEKSAAKAIELEIPDDIDDKIIPYDANHIRVHGHHYLATFEPKAGTNSGLFWELMLQEKSIIYVKLSQTGSVKSDPDKEDPVYWPALGAIAEYPADLSVKCVNEEILTPQIIKRTFEVTKNGQTTSIKQLDFSGWPDMKTPNPVHFRQLMEIVDNESKDLKDDQPITVHCGAGIGRTGTFITAHSTRDLAETDYIETIAEIRRQRPERSMVETPVQYAFLHDLMSSKNYARHLQQKEFIEALEKNVNDSNEFTLNLFVSPKTGGMSLDGSKFPDAIPGKLSVKGKQARITLKGKLSDATDKWKEAFLKDFNGLLKGTATTKEAIHALNLKSLEQEYILYANSSSYVPDKESVNKSLKIIPPDSLESISVDAHQIKLGESFYIATHQPKPKEMALFWKMIQEKHVPLIVKLTTTKKKDGEAADLSYWPKKDETFAFGKLTVKNIEEENLGSNLICRTLEIQNDSGPKSVVKLLDYNGWQDKTAPSVKEFDALMAAVGKVQKETKAGSAAGIPIAVHCGAGVGRTGTFIAAHAGRGHKEYDLFNSLKDMRQQRAYRKMLDVPEQYAFVHEYVKSSKQD